MHRGQRCSSTTRRISRMSSGPSSTRSSKAIAGASPPSKRQETEGPSSSAAAKASTPIAGRSLSFADLLFDTAVEDSQVAAPLRSADPPAVAPVSQSDALMRVVGSLQALVSAQAAQVRSVKARMSELVQFMSQQQVAFERIASLSLHQATPQQHVPPPGLVQDAGARAASGLSRVQDGDQDMNPSVDEATCNVNKNKLSRFVRAKLDKANDQMRKVLASLSRIRNFVLLRPMKNSTSSSRVAFRLA